MLCKDCQLETLDPRRGHCYAPSCIKTTKSASFKLCDGCSQQLKVCQLCQNEMDVVDDDDAATQKPGVYFVRKKLEDSGCRVKLNAGDDLQIILSETSRSPSWQVIDYDDTILELSHKGRYRSDPQGGEGSRTFVFSALAKGETEVALSDGQRSWLAKVIVKP